MKLLFVCLGNICRSPAAEAIFAQKACSLIEEGRVVIDSAGTSGAHAGELPDERMRAQGALRGLQRWSRSRPVSLRDFDDFDLIVAMDASNQAHLMAMSDQPRHRGKIKMMVDYCRKHQVEGVPDPYFGGEEGFRRVLDILEDACEGLLVEVQRELQSP